MTSPEMALLANYALYVGMGVLALAMLAFTVYLARLAPSRAEAGARRKQERELVSAGRSGATAAHPEHSDDTPANATSTGGASGGIGMSLSWLALLFLIVSIALRGLSVSRPPVANLFEFTVAGATATLLVYLVLAQRRPLRWLGLFVVVPVLSALGVALVSWYVPAAELAPALQSYWIAIHVPIAILAIGMFTVAFSVLVIQLIVERSEKRRAAQGPDAPLPSGVLALFPTAARLDRLAYSLHVAAFPLWTFTLIAGAIWGQQAWGTYWSWDPKEVWTFVIWALYAAYLHARATSGTKRRTANIIAIAGYIAIILNVTVVNMFFSGLHSYAGVS
ncbi:MAG: c-type cytochrome biogenesis protein CcsB [Mobilicoccus sp.]|nr:c-type cytochrome biogenesis protein CcsB [Mobilicoccus sp.]